MIKFQHSISQTGQKLKIYQNTLITSGNVHTEFYHHVPITSSVKKKFKILKNQAMEQQVKTVAGHFIFLVKKIIRAHNFVRKFITITFFYYISEMQIIIITSLIIIDNQELTALFTTLIPAWTVQ